MAKDEPHGGRDGILFSDAVKTAQERLGSRAAYAKKAARGAWPAAGVSEELAAFLAERDSFYLASADGDGRPYVQHRGGPKGFLKPIDGARIAFADFAGNRQYITLGHLAENDRVALILVDYPNRRRVKIWGRARAVGAEEDPDLIAALADPAYGAPVERALVVTVEAWDANCPQHIRPRYDEDDVRAATEALRRRLADLEAENAALRARLEA